MSGETDLTTMLRSMEPHLDETPFVFCSVDPSSPALREAAPLGIFREAEGLTLILEAAQAARLGLAETPWMAWISLTVHSSLLAVGLTAAVSAALAEGGISCNVIAAYYHDHLFVPWERRTEAIERLRALAAAPGAPEEREAPGRSTRSSSGGEGGI